MKYGIIGSETKADRVSLNQIIINKENPGFSGLKKGQLITGRIVSADERLVLDFNGIQINTSKDTIMDAVPGQQMTFEVLKATDTEIELKLLEETFDSKPKETQPSMKKDTDREAILSKKENISLKTKQEKDYRELSDRVGEIAAMLTEQDCRMLEEEGFPMEGFSVSGLSVALSRVKSTVSSESRGVAESQSPAASTSQRTVQELLKQENIPATQENVSRLENATELSKWTKQLDDKAIQYLISSESEPTITNIYKALYSGNVNLSHPLSEEAWGELQTQMEEVIRSTGYEVNEENLKSAKWLLENDLPLTADSFCYRKELEELRASDDKEAIINRLIEGMKNGKNPLEVALTNQRTTSGEQILEEINIIQPDSITEAVRTGTELTIHNLAEIQRNSKDEAEGDNSDNSKAEETQERLSYEEVRARRQLEEIRLRMTLEAANRMEKSGFHVETETLDRVVDALKELEDRYYQDYLREADLSATEEAVQILKETTQSVQQLRQAPCYILGSTLNQKDSQTIPELVKEGNLLQAQLERAGASYETLMTVPNGEYGDSIKKAFANSEYLLPQLKLENTEENQRAVRILGYNQMEINEQSISRIKEYDLKVSTMINHLHPAVTVRMIKEGVNPLKLTMDELNQMIDRMKEEQGITSEDKYSTYLYQLEKTEGITAEERKAYIGIYRLLYNIEKSDGAALGAVMKANQEVTLDHLLTAVQTGTRGRLDSIINDEFGTLQSLTREKESITEQLSTLREGTAQQGGDQTENEEAVQEQIKYLDRILKNLTEEITPGKLAKFSAGDTAEEMDQTVQAMIYTDGDIWGTVKDLPVDRLLSKLQQMNHDQELKLKEKIYQGKVEEVRELCKNSESSIRFLNDFKLPGTPVNLMLANHMLSNGESPVKKLLKIQNENIDEKSENRLKELNDLSDNLIDRHSMEEAYQQLETDAKTLLCQTCSQEKIDSRKLAELKLMGQQITFARTLAEKEYYQIPIETDKGITNMNLTILRGMNDAGRVNVTIRSENLGNIKADLSLKDQTLKGLICSDNRNGLELLKQSTGEIEKAASENSITLKHIDYSYQKHMTESYHYQNPITQETAFSNADTERILYRLARAVVQSVCSAENSGSETDLAVS